MFSAHPPNNFWIDPGDISTTSPCTLGTCDFIYDALLCTNLAANDVLGVASLDTSPQIIFWDNPGNISTTSPWTLGTCDFIYGALFLYKICS